MRLMILAGGDAALISAGTGLGQAALHWESDHHQPFPSGGGGVDLAPRSDWEAER